MRPKSRIPRSLRSTGTWMLAVAGVPYLSACGAAIVTNTVDQLAGNVSESSGGIQGQVSLDQSSIDAILDENPGINPL